MVKQIPRFAYYVVINFTMKKLNLLLILLVMIAMSGCAVVGGIFKAGAVVGIIAVIVLIAIIFWIVSMFSK